MKISKLAIIGSGPTAIYALQHILENSEVLLKEFNAISIFEKNSKMGYGMPFNPEFTDKYNLSNITSEEIPKLPQTLANWLREQDHDYLKELNIIEFPIKDTEVYSRIALGEYFRAQLKIVVQNLRNNGFTINEYNNHNVLDIKPISNTTTELITETKHFKFNKIIIATGHHWKKENNAEAGYFDSPWPIFKLLNNNNDYYNFNIGILGASLSAFDVVTSLAHRHGKFSRKKNKLHFELDPRAIGFKITLHDANGWLPHLQYEQEQPFREMYRHTTREALFELKNDKDNLFIETYFDKICRPALLKALEKDQIKEVIDLLKNKSFDFKQFIDTMAKKHEYVNSFVGMRKELELADKLLKRNKPIHWMETLDDLMYSLNFHTELFSAEDHLFFNNEIKPFLMNVIAALPLQSAEILLALYDADCIELVNGKVEIEDKKENGTQIKVFDDHGNETTNTYKRFINSSGNDTIEFDNFPFESLRKEGEISIAQAKFETLTHIKDAPSSIPEDAILSKDEKLYLKLGGIAIDSVYRCINKNGKPSKTIYDLAFNHIYGLRPYSYGLQACNTTSLIMVNSLLDSKLHSDKPTEIRAITKTYDKKNAL
ncbi:Acyl-CoA dehydrogenase [Winogradskyella psychrotolerans RS-3]|uniref:Acyl-CoA dehydrogenase n=1 Tax=Winogradskyella psychrotolerans RS-3 TaxID=641526 RepID=S7VVS5_9FLAO|nr:FAD/NAD(P)-binding protein [Winogradskyella psychrotolerans]EPR73502.1 Acyl-CoA dehydrogenase [Winogradskyella psychrotolerans RS-3]